MDLESNTLMEYIKLVSIVAKVALPAMDLGLDISSPGRYEEW